MERIRLESFLGFRFFGFVLKIELMDLLTDGYGFKGEEEVKDDIKYI